jgi:hypothetical protein
MPQVLEANSVGVLNTGSPCLRVRDFRESDADDVCSWVRTRAALTLVSGDSGECLTLSILARWIADAQVSLVVERELDGVPLGFCTFSDGELPSLPPEYVEMCHLIINPEFRNLFIGSRLCVRGKSLARSLGFRFLCGRIVPRNRYTLALARLHRFEDFTNKEVWTPRGFLWMRFDVATEPSASRRSTHKELGGQESP